MAVLDNAAQVLRCFGSDCTELTVTDVATRLGMPKANASRLLKAMREAGLLETIGDSKRHRPGRLFLTITAAFRSSSLLLGLASEAVTRIVAGCGHTGYVSVRDGREVLAVTYRPGSNALRVVTSIGRRLPAHAAATGRTLLARMPDAAVAALFAGGLPPASPRAPQTVPELLDRLAVVRQQGFEESSDAALAGVDALAVAVGDPVQGELVSLCIVFPGAVVGPEERRLIRQDLLREAAEIARITGDADFRAPEPEIDGAIA
ncbi:MAG: IclR family transcriptional regulator [Gemmobacter sp.]